MIICIEGGDGVGKDTVAKALAEKIDAEVINFPNDQTVTGPMIRDYLKKEWAVAEDYRDGGLYETGREKSVNGSALAFQALQIANRMELMPRLEEARRTGANMILVRYWQSAWVYGQLDGLDPDWLIAVHRSMVQPDLNILLDAPAEVCMARRAARDGALAPERYEGRLDFTRKVVTLYRGLWTQNERHGLEGEWVKLDAEKPVDLLVKGITAAVELCAQGAPPCHTTQEDPGWDDTLIGRAVRRPEDEAAIGLKQEIERLTEQVTQLQLANTEEVERRRTAEERVRQVRAAMDSDVEDIGTVIDGAVDLSKSPWAAP